MKNIPSIWCYTRNTPLLKKRELLLLNTPVTSVTLVTTVTSVTNVTPTPCLRVLRHRTIPSLRAFFRILFFGILVAFPNRVYAQKSVTRVTKIDPSFVTAFRNQACAEITESEVSVNAIPTIFRIQSVVEHFEKRAGVSFSIYYSETEDLSKGLLWLFNGICRGQMHLSVPLKKRGYYFVKIKDLNDSFSLLTIDARTTDLKVKYQKQCKPWFWCIIFWRYIKCSAICALANFCPPAPRRIVFQTEQKLNFL